MKNKLSTSGFTLIELLVTITIVAILSTIGFTTFQVLLKNTRDAKRLSDLRVIQTGLEQYYADQFFYPSVMSDPEAPLKSNTGNPIPTTTPTPIPKTYIKETPKEALASPHLAYCYKALKNTQDCDTPGTPDCDNSTDSKCTKYCLYAKLENPSSGSIKYPGTDPITGGCGSVATSNAYNFKLTPP